MSHIFIDGDFSTNKECPYHCYPSCHPCQVGPETVYGCTHPAWPMNRDRDFVPIVQCGGKIKKCDFKKHPRPLRYFTNGLRRRIGNAQVKIDKWTAFIIEAGRILE